MSLKKKCKTCLIEKPISEYYKTREWLQSNCIPCHKAKRTKSKSYQESRLNNPTAFKNIPKKTIKNIKSDIIDNKMKPKKIVEKYKLNYENLIRWQREGLLPKTVKKPKIKVELKQCTSCNRMRNVKFYNNSNDCITCVKKNAINKKINNDCNFCGQEEDLCNCGINNF